MPQFDSSVFLSQIVWMLLCFGVIFFSLSRKGIPQLKRIFEERFKKIEGQRLQADDLNAQTRKISEEVELKLIEAKTQAVETLKSAAQAANLLMASRKSELAHTMKKRVFEAEKVITQKKQKIAEDVKSIASETALAMASLLASVDVKPEGAHQVVTTMLSDPKETQHLTKAATPYVS